MQRSKIIEKGGNHVEAKLVALEQQRQSFQLWRNGEDGGRCLGGCDISVCRAAAVRTDLKGNCLRVQAEAKRHPPRYHERANQQ